MGRDLCLSWPFDSSALRASVHLQPLKPRPLPLGVVPYEGFAVSSFNRDPEEAAVDRSDLAQNRYRQLPTASALGSVLVRHSLAAGGCWPRVT